MSTFGLDVTDSIARHIRTDLPLMDENQTVEEAAKAMTQKRLGSAVIAQKGKPVGILTEWDMLVRVVAQGRDPRTTKVKEVMSAPLITVGPTATVGEVITLMIKRGVRRLVVMDGDKMVGVVSQGYLIGDRREASTPLPILELAKGVTCPYCGSAFESKEILSKHVDRLHIGSGLLEGDLRQW